MEENTEQKNKTSKTTAKQTSKPVLTPINNGNASSASNTGQPQYKLNQNQIEMVKKNISKVDWVMPFMSESQKEKIKNNIPAIEASLDQFDSKTSAEIRSIINKYFKN